MTKEITTQGGLPLQAHLAHLSIITTKRKELRQHIHALIFPPPPSLSVLSNITPTPFFFLAVLHTFCSH